MRRAYKQPIRSLFEKPIDQPGIFRIIYPIIDFPGFVYWRIREWIRGSRMGGKP